VVKRRDIIKDLLNKGMIIDEGKRNNRHARVTNPWNGLKAPLARHREISFYTVKALYKELGLEEPVNLKR
jgi:hypothetical protein